MISGFCSARFGVQLYSVVLGYQYTPQLDRAVSGARFLTVGVFECNIAHRRFVAVLCMLYEIRCNPMHPLRVLYIGRMSQYFWSLTLLLSPEPHNSAGLLFPSQCLTWSDLADPVFDGVVLRVLSEGTLLF